MLAFLKEYKLPSEKAFLALAIIALCQETLFIYPVAIVSHIGPLSFLSVLIFPITYFALAIISLRGRGVVGYISLADFGLIAFFAMYVLISTTLHPMQTRAIEDALPTEILPCIPFLFLGLCLKIDSVSMDALGKWCCVAVVLTSIYRIFYQVPDAEWEKDYNMGAAYALLPNILIATNYAFHTKKKWEKLFSFLCVVVGLFYLFAMGTRGAIVIAFAFLLLCFVMSGERINTWKIVMILLVGSLIVWLATSPVLIDVLIWLGDVLSSMGLSTRVIDFGVSGEFISNTTGREEISETLLRNMDGMPLLGYGVLAENRLNILSAHNLYLQAIYDYGYFFGILFLLFLVVITIMSVLRTKGKFTQQWILIWAVYVFVKGFFGGGVLRFEVFILIGSCLRALRMKQVEIQ